MTKQAKASPATSSEVATLASVVKELTHQVRQLALIMDEVREDLLGAVRNNRLDPCATHRMVSEMLDDQDDEDSGEDKWVAADDESPVPPQRVRPTGSQTQKSQPTLFS